MRNAVCFMIILLISLLLPGCSRTSNGEVFRYWKGYIKEPDGVESEVSITFTGRESKVQNNTTLEAIDLIIKGDSFTKDIDFKNSEGEKKGKSWSFITQSSDPEYPYGIITISSDYKEIFGRIPDDGAVADFYSNDM